jgi:hypothetical protein
LTSDQIALLILLISFGVMLATAALTIVVPSAGRNRRYNSQRAALRDVFAQPGDALELDWTRYAEVPKPEVLILAGKHSWTFSADEITDHAWLLRFTK